MYTIGNTSHDNRSLSDIISSYFSNFVFLLLLIACKKNLSTMIKSIIDKIILKPYTKIDNDVYFSIGGGFMPKVSQEYLKNRKNAITKAAVNVFSRKGYSNTSMKNIMNEAKVSRGGLYAHFENIGSVFIAVLKYDDSLQVNRLLTPSFKEPLLSQLNDWISEMVLSTQNKEANLVRAKSEFFLAHNIEEVPYLRERHKRLSKDIRKFINIGIEKGEFQKQFDVNSFCELLISMIDGVMLHQYYQYSPTNNLLEKLNLMNKMIENTLT